MLNVLHIKLPEAAKSISIVIIKLLISIGLVIYLVNRISFEKLSYAFQHLSYGFFILSIILAFLNIYIQYVRWRYILKTQNKNTSNTESLKSLFTGFTSGIITPVRVGEYFGRKIPLKEFSVLEVAALTLIDKLFLLLNVVFWGGLASILFLSFYYQVSYFIVISLFIVFCFFFYLLFFLIYSKNFYVHLRAWLNRLMHKINWLKQISQQLMVFDYYTIGNLTLLALLNYFILIIQFALLVLSFAPEGEILTFTLCSVLILFAKTLIPSVTFGEVGIRESASIYFLGIYGINEAAAFNAALMLFILNLLIPSMIGLVPIIRSKFNYNKNS